MSTTVQVMTPSNLQQALTHLHAHICARQVEVQRLSDELRALVQTARDNESGILPVGAIEEYSLLREAFDTAQFHLRQLEAQKRQFQQELERAS